MSGTLLRKAKGEILLRNVSFGIFIERGDVNSRRRRTEGEGGEKRMEMTEGVTEREKSKYLPKVSSQRVKIAGKSHERLQLVLELWSAWEKFTINSSPPAFPTPCFTQPHYSKKTLRYFLFQGVHATRFLRKT